MEKLKSMVGDSGDLGEFHTDGGHLDSQSVSGMCVQI